MTSTSEARDFVPLVAVHELSIEKRRGTTGLGAVVPLLGALIGGERSSELEPIAEQADLVMFFAMNKFGPFSARRRFSPPVSCARGRQQQ